MSDFPRRMRDWLFNVMRDLTEREELPAKYKELQHEAENNLTRRWANAAVWKFCDLDESHDRSVSIHELFPIRAPLMSLEHCIEPFLKSCDPNDDHRITLKEWGNCLQLEEVWNRLNFSRHNRIFNVIFCSYHCRTICKTGVMILAASPTKMEKKTIKYVDSIPKGSVNDLTLNKFFFQLFFHRIIK